jgi:hypothetical protein
MGGKDLFSIKKSRGKIFKYVKDKKYLIFFLCIAIKKKEITNGTKQNNFIYKYKILCIVFNFKVALEETNQFLGMAGRSITTQETSAFEDHVAIYNIETFAAQLSARNSCY